jgi:acyl dehydratase
MPSDELRYFEDFHVGMRFRSCTATMTAEDIKAFARQFDPQPFHLDEAAAKGTFFEGLAASGWHTAAVVMRLTVQSDLRPAGGTIGAGVESLRWPKPVRPGDTIRVDGEVLDVRASRSRPEIGIVKIRSTTTNQAGETVQLAEIAMVVPTRAGR